MREPDVHVFTMHTCQSTGRFSGILMSVVCRPPIVSCDPPNRLLPNELYLPVLVITAHQEQHDKSMSYCTVQSIPASTVQEQTLTVCIVCMRYTEWLLCRDKVFVQWH